LRLMLTFAPRHYIRDAKLVKRDVKDFPQNFLVGSPTLT